ncbi:MAG: IS1595 family transposase [Acidimicrobiales bacterium]
MAKKTLLRRVMDLQDDAEAYALLEELRWQGKPVCPHCGSERAYYLAPKAPEGRRTRTGSVSERRLWKCGACRKQYSVLTGTIFHGTKVSVRIWLMVVVEMCANKNGMAAREIERKYGVAPKTAWHMAHRVREGMKRRAPDMLVGTIVSDETWIGGDPRNRHGGATRPPKPTTYELLKPGERVRPNYRKTEKATVLSLLNAESGEVRSRVVPNVKASTLRKVIAEQVDMGNSDLMTDDGGWYQVIGREFRSHRSVNHSAGEYVRGKVTTNALEGFFGQLKRSIDGTHHHVSVEHLPRYLAEFDFRRSTCHLTDDRRVDRLLGQVEGRRLSYFRTRTR